MQAALLSMEATPEGIFLLPPNGKRLLVRSLSDGAKYGSSIRKRLAAQQNAQQDSELYSMSESGLKEPFYPSSDSSSSSCSCGCGDVPSLNEVEVDSSNDDEEEDEGFAKDDFEAPKSVVYVDSAERRSFSSSVDSGRSSDRDGSLNKNCNMNKISVFVPYCEDSSTVEGSLSNRTNITISNSRIQIKCSAAEEDRPHSFGSPLITPVTTHRRKDLIKLLGISEDLSTRQRFKEVQKLALKHLNTLSSPLVESTPRKKKNLAKFLGVTEHSDCDEPIPFEEFKLRVQDSSSSRRVSSPSRSSFIRNLFKSSSNHSLNHSLDSSGGGGRDGASLNYTLLQKEGKNHKDLTKFLGLNDSDSEEIIFIQNKRRNGLQKSSSCASLDSSSYCSTRPRALKTPETCSRKGILQRKTGVLSPIPCRKSVLFKEYDFSVEESIAQGLPIIPPNGERKRKKDAFRRSVEVSHGASLEELLKDISLGEKKKQSYNRSRRKGRRRILSLSSSSQSPTTPCPQHGSPPLLSYHPKGRRLVSRGPPQVLFQFIRKGNALKDFTHVQRTITKR